MRIFVLLGHPDRVSFNGELADAYVAAAEAAGHEVRRQDVGALAFDPILWKGGKVEPPLEPDLARSRENLMWCERLVIVYPMWWGTVPALLKGWMDRVLAPGFAYRYHDKGPLWDRLLGGRHAHVIRTSDAPSLWLRLVYRDCDLLCLRRAVLGFCGIRTRKVRRIGGVKALDPAARAKAIAGVARMV